MRSTNRAVTTAAALAIGGSLVAAAPAGAAAPVSAQPSSSVAATTYRDLNVPGLPISVAAPSNWPAFSPRTLYTSKTKKYPAAVVNLAKVMKKTPAQFIKDNAYINLMSYGGINTKYYASVNVMDAGAVNWSFAGVQATLKKNKATLLTTSAKKTKFGTVYRAHYRNTNAAGYKYYGVMSMVKIKVSGKIHTVLVDNTSSSSGDSLDMSNRTLASADWR